MQWQTHAQLRHTAAVLMARHPRQDLTKQAALNTLEELQSKLCSGTEQADETFRTAPVEITYVLRLFQGDALELYRCFIISREFFQTIL